MSRVFLGSTSHHPTILRLNNTGEPSISYFLRIGSLNSSTPNLPLTFPSLTPCQILFNGRQNIGCLRTTHHRNSAIWPHEKKARIVSPTAHSIISSTMTSTDDYRVNLGTGTKKQPSLIWLRLWRCHQIHTACQP